MAKRMINVYLEEVMIVRIDAIIGRRGRGELIRPAIEKELVLREAGL